jgi:hypothetical protein
MKLRNIVSLTLILGIAGINTSVASKTDALPTGPGQPGTELSPGPHSTIDGGHTSHFARSSGRANGYIAQANGHAGMASGTTLAATDEESVPVIWTELVGVNFDPARGLLTKDRAARRGWNSGAVSVQRLEAGEDGWFETELRGRYNMVAFGFSDANDDNSYRSIDYCLYVTRFSVQVYENGQRMGHYSRYRQGDKFGISRKGGTIPLPKERRYLLPIHKAELRPPDD